MKVEITYQIQHRFIQGACRGSERWQKHGDNYTHLSIAREHLQWAKDSDKRNGLEKNSKYRLIKKCTITSEIE